MTKSSVKQSATHKQVWIDNGYYEKIKNLRFMDESMNSVIVFLYEFYNAHQEDNVKYD
jgi:hypothetical protein